MMRNTKILMAAVSAALLTAPIATADDTAQRDLQRIGTDRGIVAWLGLPEGGAARLVDLAGASELSLFFQSDDPQQSRAVREAADKAGLLGQRVFATTGKLSAIALSDNLADCVLVADEAADRVSRDELLRVLRPKAAAYVNGQRLEKPLPAGIDQWTHPFHGPDNNPQSDDQLARGEFHTQFIGYPKFSPMPEQSVIAGGRIYKAMGHIAHKANQNEMLNTLLCINAYNGTVLWRRELPAGFMIHRNTMVATDDALYLGDHESCKIIDGQTGRTRGEIVVPEGISDGPVWKWMAIRDGILYALVGHTEVKVDTQKSARRGLGHWPWGMWQGHDYADPKTAFGFGRTLIAFDPTRGQLLWSYRDQDFLDARATCMSGNRIYTYSPEKSLTCINAETGKPIWQNSEAELLQAIGPNGKAQHYITGYATTCYMKCTDRYLFFAGPQRERTVVASAEDGKLAWTYPVGNLQLVLRDDAVYAAGPQNTNGVRLDYDSGQVLATFPARRACTRATGCADSIFFRASGGTVRVMTESNTAQHIAPMRPPCQDGVLVSNGHLYWGPWMCGCQLSLYGNICLAPVASEGEPSPTPDAFWADANPPAVEPLEISPADWPAYRSDNARTDQARRDIPSALQPQWDIVVAPHALPTAPVAAGGMVFVADRAGAVQGFNASGTRVWKTLVGGPVYYPPAVAHDRLYLGSADGRVYALAARSGKVLWSHRVAPQDRWIRVYDKLISRWPVAGGVVVNDNRVYAAAGITHYDGTYVVALDAVTGELRASNGQSGVISPEVNNGISLQGNLTIVNDELRFLAGGVYETARYDLDTLQCLNEPVVEVSSQFRTAFYPYYPDYAQYVSLDYTCPDGCNLSHDASYEGSLFTDLALHEPLPPGAPKPPKEAARWIRRRGGRPPQLRWTDRDHRRFTGFIVSPTRLLAAGHAETAPDQPFLMCLNVQDGSDQWRQPLPSNAVKGGLAMDQAGRVFVSLENGHLLCFGPTP